MPGRPMTEEQVQLFLLCFPNFFSMCLDSDKTILPLCYKHVILKIFTFGIYVVKFTG